MSEPRPGVFKIIRSNAGYRLVLDGAQGERVVVSEVHPHKREAKEALDVILRSARAIDRDTSLAFAAGQAVPPTYLDIDERGTS